MRKRFPGFLGATYTAQASQADTEQLMNFFIQRMESRGAKSDAILLPTPGVRSLVDVQDNVRCRGSFSRQGHVYKVIGNGFYEIFENNTNIRRGTVAVNGYPGTISHNGDTQMLITSGDNAYLFDTETLAFTQVLTGSARMGAVLNATFQVFDPNTGRVYSSAPGDGLTWDPLNFFARQLGSDPPVAYAVNNYGEGWFMGEQTSEIWEPTADEIEPFAPRANLIIPWGCLAPFSIVNDDASMTWLARNKAGAGMVVGTSGFNPQEISDSSLTAALGEERETTRIDDVEAWSYEEDGQPFTILNLPTADKTKALDRKTGQWHDRGTWDTTKGRYGRWQVNYHSYEWNKHIVGDASTGNVYRLSRRIATDVGGALIRRVRRAPAIFAQGEKVTYDALEIFLQSGVGTIDGQGQNPTLTLYCSDDGGKTFWSAGSRAAGAMGQYAQQIIWNRLGPSRNRVFELVMSDPVPWQIVDAYLNVS